MPRKPQTPNATAPKKKPWYQSLNAQIVGLTLVVGSLAALVLALTGLGKNAKEFLLLFVGKETDKYIIAVQEMHKPIKLRPFLSEACKDDNAKFLSIAGNLPNADEIKTWEKRARSSTAQLEKISSQRMLDQIFIYKKDYQYWKAFSIAHGCIEPD